MKKTLKPAIIGFVTGLGNGLFGAGGGTILVPLMQRYLGVETHKSHATAIAVILPLSILSAFIYARGGSLDWRMTLYISIGGIVGGIVGAKILNNVPKTMLRRIFGIFMIAAALRMIL